MASSTSISKNFKNIEATLLDKLNTLCATIKTTSGTAVRELVIRPMAYLANYVQSLLDTMLNNYNMSNLLLSQATSNTYADIIASNYFVTRNTSKKSSGMVSFITTLSTYTIQAGYGLVADGTNLVIPRKCIVSPIVTTTDDSTSDTSSLYIQSYVYGEGTYIASIPVEAAESGEIEIPVNAVVSIQFVASYIVDLFVSSAITGGCDAETDASMLARCKYICSTCGVSNKYTILRQIQEYNSAITNIILCDQESFLNKRARFNSTAINSGGKVDCYLKTQNQTSIGVISCTATYDAVSKLYKASITSEQYAGFYSVNAVYYNGALVDIFNVTYTSTSQAISADGARFSKYQAADIYIQGKDISTDPPETIDIQCSVEYMPGINELQAYLDRPDKHIVGQNILVKGAPLVKVHFSCAYRYVGNDDTVTEDTIKSKIALYINSIPIGTGVINFSEVCDSLQATYPELTLVLPCVMTAQMPTNLCKTDSFYTNTGILDIKTMAGTDVIDYSIVGFSVLTDDVTLSEL